MSQIIKIASISELHRALGLEKPRHPAISLVKNEDMVWPDEIYNQKYVWEFYTIALKQHDGEIYYGRNHYDFEEGSLIFTSPGQVLESGARPTHKNDSGWSLFFHPDLLLQSDLAAKISSYTFFTYAVHEALHVSEYEKATILRCAESIEAEYNQNIDRHSQTVIVANLELLLNYCNRYYDRQFYTRSNHQQDVVEKVESLLLRYFNSDLAERQGIPSVAHFAEQVNLSPNYLSDLLKKETGKTTQEHIHYRLIERAKHLLLRSDAPVSEIAYQLGFEYPQYFGTLFKKKVGLSPNKFRQLN
ncbi:AraC family transcriptional regulator [Lewinellaceae bacterium SD302]|nr:AraC family transcriptional regulator [Lewinellaceae bacterium SD302]